jgi:hypothetical protein
MADFPAYSGDDNDARIAAMDSEDAARVDEDNALRAAIFGGGAIVDEAAHDAALIAAILASPDFVLFDPAAV